MAFYTQTVSVSNRPSLWQKIETFFNVLGYSRAAAELARLGHYEEAKKCMMEISRLKN